MTEQEKRMLQMMKADGGATDRADDAKVFDWGELGEKWWRDAGAQFKASEAQIKFACAKHRCASNAGAAREAGYAGCADNDIAKQSGYKAFRTTSVQNLLAFAAAEAKGGNDGTVDGGEARRILSKLARGSDPTVKIRAIEALQKLDDKATELGRRKDDDGLWDWRIVRDYLQMRGGPPAILHLWRGLGNGLSAMPLLHDVHKAVSSEAPEAWDGAVRQSSAVERASLEKRLSDPQWQREPRQKLWREVGVEIDAPPIQPQQATT